MFCRVLHFYGYTHEEVLKLPLRIFWLLNDTLERIRAEQNIHNLRVGISTQSSEGYKETYNEMKKRMGETVVVNDLWLEENTPKDTAGMNELRQMFGAR